MRNERYFRYKAAGTCVRCGAKRTKNSVYCAPHREYHRARSRKRMAVKRDDPAYCDEERAALRERMRKLRASPDYVRPDR